MYRVVLYYLIALLVLAGTLGLFHILSYSPFAIGYSVAILIASSWLTNFIFARVWHAVPGTASLYITALILALIVTPVTPGDLMGSLLLALIGVWGMASKYIFAINGKHVFNPAAFAVVVSSLVFMHGASWWVAGNLPLMAVIVLGGLLIVRKIQRFDLFLSFTAASLLTIAFTTNTDPLHAVWTTLIHSSFFFLAFAMLTEPATMPPTRSMRIAYGILVGIWFAPAIHIGSFYFTPELALLLGNVFVYAISPKGRFMLTLTEKNQLAKDTVEFVFAPAIKHSFYPGQYLEWTIPEGKGTDNKGNRRYFTIASSPTEKNLRLAVKTGAQLSSFKQKLMELRAGDTITAAHLAGDFTLPEKESRKVAFIAGGIGVTPFRAMVGSMLDRKQKRDAVLLYSNKTVEEVAYYDVFERARIELGMKTIYALSNDTQTFPGSYAGLIDAELIKREIPDYRERMFYISGPRAMVVAFQKTLHELGLPLSHIKSDYFPGFV